MNGAHVIEERVRWIDCMGERLLGVVSPGASDARVGVLIIVGGRQYRAGSGRFFVTAARALSAAGAPVLRFDARGMGDSPGAWRTFEDIGADIGAAIDAMHAEFPQLEGVVLWGLCDAASAALLYWGATHDARVRGMVLLNPWVRSPETLARTRLRHHYRSRVSDPQFWSRLIKGRVHWRSLGGWWADWRAARAGRRSGLAFQAAMARALRDFKAPVTLVLSEHDETALEFVEVASTLPEWAGVLQRANVREARVQGADHTFSLPDHRQQVTEATLRLLSGLEALEEPAAAAHRSDSAERAA